MTINLIPLLQDKDEVMDQQQPPLHPQLYSTSHRSYSDSSEGEREDYYYNPELVRPGNPAPDLRQFAKTPKFQILTSEGRKRLRSLRTNVGGPYDQKRATRLAENPETPQQSIETPSRSQTETHTHRSPEKRKPLSIPKLFGWVPSPDSQYKITTPRDIPSPEFINQTYDLDKRDLESLKLNQEEKIRSPFTHFMDNNGVILNQANMSSVNPNEDSANLTDTIPLTDNLRQQILNYPPPPTTNEIPMGATGFSPPLQEQDLITDQTQYRMPANVPIIEDLGPDLTLPPNRGLGARPRPGNPLYVPTTPPRTAEMSSVYGNPLYVSATPRTAEMSSVYGMPGMFQTPQTAAISEMSNVYGMPGMFQTPQTAAISSVNTNTTTHVENQILSPAPQMQIVRQTLPVVQNTLTQQVPQQLIQIPQSLAEHTPQQIPSYVVQNQPVQSPLHQTLLGFVASTPPAQVQSVHRSPNLSPISVRAQQTPRAPPGFAESEQGRQAPWSNAQNNILELFKPIKGSEYLPESAPGCILNSKEEQFF